MNNLIQTELNEPLANDLRLLRRNAGFAQHEVASLMGYKTYGVVSRHEQSGLVPSLVAALGYQVLFRVPVSHIFPGLTETVELTLQSRLVELEDSLGELSANSSRANAIARKMEWLSKRRSSGGK